MYCVTHNKERKCCWWGSAYSPVWLLLIYSWLAFHFEGYCLCTWSLHVWLMLMLHVYIIPVFILLLNSMMEWWKILSTTLYLKSISLANIETTAYRLLDCSMSDGLVSHPVCIPDLCPWSWDKLLIHVTPTKIKQLLKMKEWMKEWMNEGLNVFFFPFFLYSR